MVSISATPGFARPETAAVRVAIDGGEDWFEILVRDHTAMAFAVALRVVKDPTVAEDVVQEAFLSVWRQARTYDRDRGSLRTWLLTVVRNRAIDRLRSEHSRPTGWAADLDSILDLASDSDVWADVSAAIDRDSVRAGLGRLPAEQRRTIELAYFSGLTHVEIAETMDVPLGTVKGRMRMGLQKLRLDLYEAVAA